ncbi:MAG: tRNA pseudouridine(55) synthase TruB [Rhodospirillaceae bacterium]|nr:tRNA pseudouridine(55) synthase TruB [Rhodospirillaceae bacterium]|tara:strand:+ start:8688 stop:9620 length:933 start_codon:yes stop_codon:yes gene_type:complete
MARKRRGQPIHGWISVDKPEGRTSAQVTAQVRKLLDAAKAGHGGTLDPIATGVLPIALGEATKTVSYVMDGKKRYRFTVRWGEERSTDDREGEVTSQNDHRPDQEEILAVLPEFVGVIEQVPPNFSAIKVDGKRAYKLARAGEEVSIAKRQVEIAEFSLVSILDRDNAVFEVSCGKGTYIRSLARDMARRLNTVGHVAELRRTQCGPFSENVSISLESLETLVHSAPPSAYLLAVETALDDIPALALSADQADHLRHGRPVRTQDLGGHSLIDTGSLVEGDVLCAKADGQPVALARFVSGEIRAVRVLNI